MAEGGSPFQLENKLSPEFKKAVAEIPKQNFDNKVPSPTLDDNRKRWLIVGICLHDIVSPTLRTYIEPIVSRLYNSLKLSDQIETKNVALLPQKTFNHKLEYKSINNNIHLHKNQYDFRIQSHVDLSKTFLQSHMAKYTGFDSSCDSSALLGIMVNICDQRYFPVNVQSYAKQVRSDIRNPWAHCDFTEWDCTKYTKSFTLMETLIKELSLKAAYKTKVLGDLKKWETCGMQFVEGSTLGLELVKDIYQHTKTLSEYVKVFAKETDVAFEKVWTNIQLLETDLVRRIENLEMKVDMTTDRVVKVENCVNDLENVVVNLTDGMHSLREQVTDESERVDYAKNRVDDLTEDVNERFNNMGKKIHDDSDRLNDVEDRLDNVTDNVSRQSVHTADQLKNIESQRLNDVKVQSERMENLEKQNNPIKNLIYQSESSIERHNKDQLYVKTNDEEEAKRILRESNLVILAAKAGSGKSTMSIQLADMYRNEGYSSIILIDNQILSMMEKINFETTCILIIEDLFGRTHLKFDENIHKNFLDKLSDNLHSKKCRTKVIMTIRQSPNSSENILECHEIFKSPLVVKCNANLSILKKKELLFTHMSKFQIFECSCSKIKCCENDVEQRDDHTLHICKFVLQKIIECDTLVGFPQACHIFCSDRNMTKLGLKYFTNTNQILLESINNLCAEGYDNQRSRYQYVVLVYIALVRGIDLNKINEELIKKIISEIYDVNESRIKMPLLKDVVKKMIGTYIKNASNRERIWSGNMNVDSHIDYYVSQHTSISEAVLISFGDECLDIVLSFCDVRFIIEYVRPKGYRHCVDQYMAFLFVDEKCLAYTLWSKFKTFDMFSLGSYIRDIALICRNEEFMSLFMDYITEPIDKDDYHSTEPIDEEDYHSTEPIDEDDYHSTEPIYEDDFHSTEPIDEDDYHSTEPIDEDDYHSADDSWPFLKHHCKDLLDGLTNYGKCSKFIQNHKNCFQRLAKYGSVEVTCAFCRPSSCIETDQDTIKFDDTVLANQLFCLLVDPHRQFGKFFEDLDGNNTLWGIPEEIYTIHDANKQERIGMYLNNIGGTPEGNAFVKRVLSKFDSIPYQLDLVNPWTVRSLFDGLTDHGNQCANLSRIREFCQNYLLKYGGIRIILNVCRPRSMSFDDQELVAVDDELLARKLMDQLTYNHYDDDDETTYSMKDHAIKFQSYLSYEKKLSHNNLQYIFFKDKEYNDQLFLGEIGNYIYQYGVEICNETFLEMVCSRINLFEEYEEDDDPLYSKMMEELYGPPEPPVLCQDRLEDLTEGLTDDQCIERCRKICDEFPYLADALSIKYFSDEEGSLTESASD